MQGVPNRDILCYVPPKWTKFLKEKITLYTYELAFIVSNLRAKAARIDSKPRSFGGTLEVPIPTDNASRVILAGWRG